MLFYLDTYSWEIWSKPTRSRIVRFTFERGATEPIQVKFVTDGTVVELGSGAGTLGFKQAPGDTSFLFTSVAWTKTGTGTSTVYTFLPQFLSTAFDTAIGTNPTLTVYGEISWTDSTTAGVARMYPVTILANVNRGGESVPTATTIKVYRALLTQTGTSAPSVTVLENGLSAAIVWTRAQTGTYTGTLASAFTANKTFLLSPAAYDTFTFHLSRTSANAVTLVSQDGASESDGVLNADPIEILVYP